MKFGFRYYFRPTPKNIKHAADAILATFCTAGVVSTLIDFYPKSAIPLFIIGVVCKLLSNFFANE